MSQEPAAVQVIAHRGVPGERPENTLASFALALEQGADGMELDVHLTADDRIVVHHDPRLVGEGGRETGPAIRDTPLRALREASAVELPELSDVVELVGGRARLYVELKGDGVALPVARLLGGMTGEFAVHAFDHRAILQLASAAPELQRGVLMAARAIDPVGVVRAAGATTLWQEGSLLDGELVSELHGAGCAVIAWTVNDPSRARALVAAGVDGICTDRPGALRRALARPGLP